MIDTPKLRQRHIIELQQYSWPGNIRELQNVVERAVISCRSGPLNFHLPQPDADSADESAEHKLTNTEELMTDDDLRKLERQNLFAVLEKANWKISGTGGAAQFLGVHPATLSSRMRTMGIKRPGQLQLPVNGTHLHHIRYSFQSEDMTMAGNVATDLELKEEHLEYVDAMAKKYNLPDRSKALRCLITFAMQETEREASIFNEIRCVSC